MKASDGAGGPIMHPCSSSSSSASSGNPRGRGRSMDIRGVGGPRGGAAGAPIGGGIRVVSSSVPGGPSKPGGILDGNFWEVGGGLL